MPKTASIILPIIVFVFFSFAPVIASDNHTQREEKEGKVIWDKLQSRQATCDQLSDEDFGRLGEYYMGQMVGGSHQAMNTMMQQMMGEDGEEQMHVVMGKRLSGCDTSAAFPNQGLGFMPIAWMTRGGGPMMGFGPVTGWGGFGFFGFLVSLFWIVVLIDLILLGIWLWKKIQQKK